MGQKITRTAEIIEHKGARILVTDFSGLSGQEIADAIKGNSRALASKMIPGKKDWLALHIFTDCFLDEAALKAFSKVLVAMEKFFIAIADVGMNSIQRTGVEIAVSESKTEIPYRFFNDVDDAKDWLVSMYSNHVNKGKYNVSRPIEW